MVNKNFSKFVTGAATAVMVTSVLVPVVGADETKSLKSSFSDVGPNNSHIEGIDYVKNRNITTGYEDGTFRPGDSIKRIHVALMIARAFDADPNGNYPDAGFTDVPENYKWAVNFLVSQGIIKGKSPTYFGSNDNATRAHMAKIIANAYNLKGDDTKGFEFVDFTKEFKPYIKALADNGVTIGISPTHFGSSNDVTRGQFATFVYRVETAKDVDVEVPKPDVKDPVIPKPDIKDPVVPKPDIKDPVVPKPEEPDTDLPYVPEPTFPDQGDIVVNPYIVSAEKIHIRGVQLTFNEIIDDSSLVPPFSEDDFILKVNGSTVAYQVFTDIVNDNKIVLYIDESYKLSDKVEVQVVSNVSQVTIKDIYGNKIVRGNNIIAK